MSINCMIASPNEFVGMNADVTRVALISSTRHADKVRALWSKFVLPKVTTTEFFKGVVASDAFLSVFRLEVDPEFDTSIPWNTYNHVAAYQNLAQIADKNVPSRLVPWQIRFEFAPETHSRLIIMPSDVEDAISECFAKAGWLFWLTKTGFCITPLALHNEIRSIAALDVAWGQMRDFKGAGFEDFAVESDDDDAPIDIPSNKMPALEGYPSGGSNAAAGSALGRSA